LIQARNMIVEPELLLLDEPFGALDECTKEGKKNCSFRLWLRQVVQ
jgi:ABC-type nitrate/sulfonate/bicarbonate transport system ATPase subunit